MLVEVDELCSSWRCWWRTARVISFRYHWSSVTVLIRLQLQVEVFQLAKLRLWDRDETIFSQRGPLVLVCERHLWCHVRVMDDAIYLFHKTGPFFSCVCCYSGSVAERKRNSGAVQLPKDMAFPLAHSTNHSFVTSCTNRSLVRTHKWSLFLFSIFSQGRTGMRWFRPRIQVRRPHKKTKTGKNLNLWEGESSWSLSLSLGRTPPLGKVTTNDASQCNGGWVCLFQLRGSETSEIILKGLVLLGIFWVFDRQVNQSNRWYRAPFVPRRAASHGEYWAIIAWERGLSPCQTEIDSSSISDKWARIERINEQ